jgi:hypothetical protein
MRGRANRINCPEKLLQSHLEIFIPAARYPVWVQWRFDYYLHDDMIPKLICSKCGGKKLGMIVQPYNKANLVNPFNHAEKLR